MQPRSHEDTKNQPILIRVFVISWLHFLDTAYETPSHGRRRALRAFRGPRRAQAPDRTRPPQPGPPPAVQLPTIQKRQLSNGLPVWLVEAHEVPVAQVNLVVLRGSADDPTGKFGVATLTASMLLEGAGTRSSLELADAVDFLGADLSAAAGIDSSAVRLHVPVARLADALPLMADVALRPTFPAEELERLRQERLTGILQARDNPATINATAFNRVLYGAAHRYGTPVNGTAATLRSFTTDDLRAFYASAFQPANAALLVVGDVTMDKALPLLESSFGGWKAPGPPARTGRAARRSDARRAHHLYRRQARGPAVADPHRLDRRRPVDAGLLSDPGDEHDSRRLVLVAAEPEPAREERLYLRRELRVRHARVGRTVCCDSRSAD